MSLAMLAQADSRLQNHRVCLRFDHGPHLVEQLGQSVIETLPLPPHAPSRSSQRRKALENLPQGSERCASEAGDLCQGGLECGLVGFVGQQQQVQIREVAPTRVRAPALNGSDELLCSSGGARTDLLRGRPRK